MFPPRNADEVRALVKPVVRAAQWHQAEVAAVTGTTVTLTICGDTVTLVPYLASYTPTSGDVVEVLAQDGRIVVVGKLGAGASFPAGGASGQMLGSDGSGGVAWISVSAYVAVTSTYAASADDTTIDCTANTFTVTLPDVTTVEPGKALTVKNSGSGTVTVDGHSAQTIDGALTVSLYPLEALSLVCTGTTWRIT